MDTWTDARGVETPVARLDDAHLLNIVAYVERNAAALAHEHQLACMTFIAGASDAAQSAWGAGGPDGMYYEPDDGEVMEDVDWLRTYWAAFRGVWQELERRTMP